MKSTLLKARAAARAEAAWTAARAEAAWTAASRAAWAAASAAAAWRHGQQLGQSLRESVPQSKQNPRGSHE